MSNTGNVPPVDSTVQAEMVIDKPHPQHFHRQIQPRQPTKEQLAETHQLVIVKNIHEKQTLGVIDRFLHRHEFQPGQEKELDLGKSQIEHIVSLASTDRGNYAAGPKEKVGRPLDEYPIKIISLGTIFEAEKAAEDDLKAREAVVDREYREMQLAKKNAELAEHRAQQASTHQRKGASQSS